MSGRQGDQGGQGGQGSQGSHGSHGSHGSQDGMDCKEIWESMLFHVEDTQISILREVKVSFQSLIWCKDYM